MVVQVLWSRCISNADTATWLSCGPIVIEETRLVRNCLRYVAEVVSPLKVVSADMKISLAHPENKTNWPIKRCPTWIYNMY